MTITEELRRPFETKPFYAAAGVVDVTVERLRKANADLMALYRRDPAETRKQIMDRMTEVQGLPQRAQTVAHDVQVKVDEVYDELAERGRKLVQRIEEQPATQHAVEQAKTTLQRTRIARATTEKGAKTTVRRARTTTRKAARSTNDTAHTMATKAAEATKSAVESATETAEATRTAVVEAVEKIGDSAVAGS